MSTAGYANALYRPLPSPNWRRKPSQSSPKFGGLGGQVLICAGSLLQEAKFRFQVGNKGREMR